MNDRPDAGELLRAVERFLEADVVPALDGVRRFHARVAANVVAIVARELETQEAHLRSEWEGLTRLLGDAPALPETLSDQRAGLVQRNEELVRRIRAGEADQGPWREAVLSHLERVVAQKLEVSHPPRQR
ncbi:MAG TPA: hypothetical protein DEP35_03665 [Deltaproteobacteria bacterium]|jgi:hypothetical protein|nr:hypothetical protein [Deltaproteobacteria bacterium]